MEDKLTNKSVVKTGNLVELTSKSAVESANAELIKELLDKLEKKETELSKLKDINVDLQLEKEEAQLNLEIEREEFYKTGGNVYYTNDKGQVYTYGKDSDFKELKAAISKNMEKSIIEENVNLKAKLEDLKIEIKNFDNRIENINKANELEKANIRTDYNLKIDALHNKCKAEKDIAKNSEAWYYLKYKSTERILELKYEKQKEELAKRYDTLKTEKLKAEIEHYKNVRNTFLGKLLIPEYKEN